MWLTKFGLVSISMRFNIENEWEKHAIGRSHLAFAISYIFRACGLLRWHFDQRNCSRFKLAATKAKNESPTLTKQQIPNEIHSTAIGTQARISASTFCGPSAILEHALCEKTKATNYIFSFRHLSRVFFPVSRASAIFLLRATICYS